MSTSPLQLSYSALECPISLLSRFERVFVALFCQSTSMKKLCPIWVMCYAMWVKLQDNKDINELKYYFNPIWCDVLE